MVRQGLLRAAAKAEGREALRTDLRLIEEGALGNEFGEAVYVDQHDHHGDGDDDDQGEQRNPRSWKQRSREKGHKRGRGRGGGYGYSRDD